MSLSPKFMGKTTFALSLAGLLALAPLASCSWDDTSSATSDSSQSSLRIGAIFGGSVTASGWDRDGLAAIEAMAEEIGAEADTADLVAFDQAKTSLDRFASDGYDVVIATSSGYESAILEAAAEYPDTQFVLFSDISTTDVPDNVAAWKVNWNELGYVMGTAMCTISETGIVGHVSSAPIPAFTRMAGGIQQATEEQGACAEQSDALKVTFTGSFTDASLARSAATAMVGRGATVLSDENANAEAVVSTAVEKNVPYVGSIVDISSSAPDLVATSVTIDFAAAYGELGSLLDGEGLEPGGIYDVNFSTGGLTFTTPVVNVPNAEDVESAMADVVSGIVDGSVDVDETREVTE